MTGNHVRRSSVAICGEVARSDVETTFAHQRCRFDFGKDCREYSSNVCFPTETHRIHEDSWGELGLLVTFDRAWEERWCTGSRR